MERAKQFTLKDGRILILRPPELSDAADLLAYLPEVGAETDFLLVDEHGLPDFDLDDERDWIQRTLDTPDAVMLLGFVDGMLAALCDVRPGGRPRTAHNGTLAITVKRDFWHIGIGSVLMQELIGFAHGADTLEKLLLEVRADNARAIALYERFGFRTCGRKARHVKVRGEYFDELLMELPL